MFLLDVAVVSGLWTAANNPTACRSIAWSGAAEYSYLNSQTLGSSVSTIAS
jgi:hypothetical protein